MALIDPLTRANLLGVANAGTTEDMARRKRTPELSTITRTHTVAYSRKQKPDGGDEDEAVDPAQTDADLVKAALATMKIQQPSDGRAETVVPGHPATKPGVDQIDTLDAAAEPNGGEPEPIRARVETQGMPHVISGFGFPPEMPVEQSPVPARGGVVEAPTHMPGPRDVPAGSPDDLASPPGRVPPGDSRSLRRRGDTYEFALIYRIANAVISRVGIVGARGVWRVVEYPTTASASHAYAKEASRFVSDGFSDYRE